MKKKECNKHKFKTLEEANEYSKNRFGASVYHCKECDCLHITTGIVGRVNKPLKQGWSSILREAWTEWHIRKRNKRNRRGRKNDD